MLRQTKIRCFAFNTLSKTGTVNILSMAGPRYPAVIAGHRNHSDCTILLEITHSIYIYSPLIIPFIIENISPCIFVGRIFRLVPRLVPLHIVYRRDHHVLYPPILGQGVSDGRKYPHTVITCEK